MFYYSASNIFLIKYSQKNRKYINSLIVIMNKHKIIIPLIVVLLLLFSCNRNRNKNLQNKRELQKVENLKSFAKLYGYVRYFYPSDEASLVDWDKFICYGIEKVSEAKSKEELKTLLKQLFQPIAPQMNIYFSENKILKQKCDTTSDDKTLVTWQYKGLGLYKGSIYQNVRLGRVNLSELDYGISREFTENDFSKKRFELRINGLSANSTVEKIDLLSYVSNESNFIDTKLDTIVNGNVFQNLIIRGYFPENTKYVKLNIKLMGEGNIEIQRIKFLLFDEDNKADTLIFVDKDWDIDELNNWEISGIGYTYHIDSSKMATVLQIKSEEDVISGSIFKKSATLCEVVNKDLGNDLLCQIPLALNLPKEEPTFFKSDFDSLNNRIQNIKIEKTTANEETTRIGAVIVAWNIYKHFYPYFDVIPQNDWDVILGKTLAKAISDKNEQECLLTLRKMSSYLYDGHAVVMHKFTKSLKRLPIQFDYIDNKIVVVKSNNKNIKRGDILVEIDGSSANEIFNNLMALSSGSPQWKKVRAFMYFTLDDTNKIFDLKIKRDNNILTIQANRKGVFPEYQTKKAISKLQNNVYYVDLNRVTMKELNSKLADISTGKGVIFDLRGLQHSKIYPEFIGHFTDNTVLSQIWNIPEIIYPDMENIVGYDTSGRWIISPLKPKIKGKVVFLANENAISYSESFLSIIKYYHLATIVGTPTAGANGDINVFRTMGGFVFVFTGTKVLNQDYTQHHLRGVKPDIFVSPTIESIKNGRDEILEKGIEIIKNKI